LRRKSSLEGEGHTRLFSSFIVRSCSNERGPGLGSLPGLCQFLHVVPSYFALGLKALKSQSSASRQQPVSAKNPGVPLDDSPASVEYARRPFGTDTRRAVGKWAFSLFFVSSLCSVP
jgi:hypothetical protein